MIAPFNNPIIATSPFNPPGSPNCINIGTTKLKSITVYVPYEQTGFSSSAVPLTSGSCAPSAQYLSTTGLVGGNGPYTWAIDPVTLKWSGPPITSILAYPGYPCELIDSSQTFSNLDTGVVSRALALIPAGGLDSINYGTHIVITPNIDATITHTSNPNDVPFNYVCSIVDGTSNADPCSCLATYTGGFTTTVHTLDPDVWFSEVLGIDFCSGGFITYLQSSCINVTAEDGTGNQHWKICLFQVELDGYSACIIESPTSAGNCDFSSAAHKFKLPAGLGPVTYKVDHSSICGQTRLYIQSCHCSDDACCSTVTGPSVGCVCY